jgi:2-octaprenyl-6-methoxyphenol hydroxylase
MKTLIIGAGPVGLAAALAMKRAGVGGDITLLEAAAKGNAPFSDRNIALSTATWRSLERIGVDTRHALRAPIVEVDVTQQGVFGMLRLRASDVNETELGAAMPYPDLKTALDEAVERTAISVMWNAKAARIETVANHAVVHLETGEALTADFVAIADGAGQDNALMPSFKRFERDSGQVAVIAKVAPTKPMHGVAFERFTRGGALALIPRAARADAITHEAREWTLVWARTKNDAARLLECDEDTFAREINDAFGGAMGALHVVSKRTSYPLVWRFVEPRVSGCVVAIGNAAQGLHPVAAQGLNLGLRDAMQLADALAENANVAQALSRFARTRAIDRATSIGFTGLLAYGFDRGGWIFDAPRGLALTALALATPIKRALIRSLAM